jgi:hypothetical protein
MCCGTNMLNEGTNTGSGLGQSTTGQASGSWSGTYTTGQPCPYCNRCPGCGRPYELVPYNPYPQPYYPYPYYPYYPIQYYGTPTWSGTITC